MSKPEKAVAPTTAGKEDVGELAASVQSLVEQRPPKITSEVELHASTGWLATVRKRRKDVEEFFNRLVKPFREAIAKHNRERDNMLAQLRQYEADLDTEIRDYRAREAQRAAAAQAKAQEQYEKRVERAVEQGKDSALVKPPPVVAAPAKSIATKAGTVGFRKERRFKILDPKRVPAEYWIIDEIRVGKAVRAGIDVPGCAIWIEEISVVR